PHRPEVADGVYALGRGDNVIEVGKVTADEAVAAPRSDNIKYGDIMALFFQHIRHIRAHEARSARHKHFHGLNLLSRLQCGPNLIMGTCSSCHCAPPTWAHSAAHPSYYRFPPRLLMRCRMLQSLATVGRDIPHLAMLF